MPFYEYECSSCKFYTEVMQKITDPPLRKCPSCGKNTLKKLVSAPNFRLKGGGWYETDFKSDKEAKHNLAQAEKSEPAEKTGAKEAKPAESAGAKPESKPAEAKGAEPKAAPETSSRKSVSVSRKAAAPQRAAKAKRARAGPRTKARPARKARR